MTVARRVWRPLSCSAAPPTQAAFHVDAGTAGAFCFVGASSKKPGNSALTKLASGAAGSSWALWLSAPCILIAWAKDAEER